MDVELGRRVHQLMWEKKVTQTALGRVIDADQSTVGKKLRGARKWTLDEVRLVAVELGTTVAYLFGEVDDDGTAGPGAKRRRSDYSSVVSIETFRSEKTAAHKAVRSTTDATNGGMGA